MLIYPSLKKLVVRRTKFAILLITLIILPSTICAVVVVGPFASTFKHPDSGLDTAPDFTTTLYSGGTGEFTLSDQEGRAVVINIWATWCPPCLAEFPDLERAWNRYKDQGLVLFGINAQLSPSGIKDTEQEAKVFLRQQETTFMTGPDVDGRISHNYQVNALPSTYFITPDGKILGKWRGRIDQKELNRRIEELLAL